MKLQCSPTQGKEVSKQEERGEGSVTSLVFASRDPIDRQWHMGSGNFANTEAALTFTLGAGWSFGGYSLTRSDPGLEGSKNEYVCGGDARTLSRQVLERGKYIAEDRWNCWLRKRLDLKTLDDVILLCPIPLKHGPEVGHSSDVPTKHLILQPYFFRYTKSVSTRGGYSESMTPHILQIAEGENTPESASQAMAMRLGACASVWRGYVTVSTPFSIAALISSGYAPNCKVSHCIRAGI